MKGYAWIAFFVAAALCSPIFLGCATVPTQTIEEKEAAIKNLNSKIDALTIDVDALKKENAELQNIKSQLEEELNNTKQKLEEANNAARAAATRAAAEQKRQKREEDKIK